MVIKVLCSDNTYDLVKANRLDELIAEGKILEFERTEGWIKIGRDPIRSGGTDYKGPERRSTVGFPADFFG